MFEILKEWDVRLHERYMTVERNIKAKSNSFYDAYLDLQEQFLLYVLGREGVTFEGRKTCGEILRQDATRAVFCEKMGLLLEVYNKMGDYVLKINAHKHKGEKHVQLETVLSYMRLFHTVLARVATSWGKEILPFDEEYFCNKFAAFEKENRLLWEQLNALKAELESYASESMAESERQAYESLTDSTQVAGLGIEEQNQELLRQIACLKDIKLGILGRLSSLEEGHREILQAIQEMAEKKDTLASFRGKQPHVERTAPPSMTIAQYAACAKQSYLWFGTPDMFQRAKRICLILIACLVGVMLLATVVTTSGFGIYSTYTLFENIYLIFVLCMLGHVLRANRIHDVGTYATKSMYRFSKNREGVWIVGKKKKKYVVFLVLSCVCAFLNIICLWTDIYTADAGRFWIVLFELAVFGLSIATMVVVDNFFLNYTMIRLDVRTTMEGIPRSLFYDPLSGSIRTAEEIKGTLDALKY